MRVLSLKALACGAAALLATQVFAGTPPARTLTHMVYDNVLHRMILYGGETALDGGTQLAFDLNDTWFFGDSKWVQAYPAHDAGNRGGQNMVWDSARKRVVMFGGRDQKTEKNDTWQFVNGDWSQIVTPNSPPVRHLAGAAYDSVRDRIVLFGGIYVTTNVAGVATTNYAYDTWEFDGTTWTQRQATGPTVQQPVLAYDEARNQVIMVGVDTKLNPLQYVYDAGAGSWTQVTPSNLPPCVDEASLMYNRDFSVVMLAGGTCASPTGADIEYEWNGQNWTTLTPPTTPTRFFGAALAYDTDRHRAVLYGGTSGGITASTTSIYFNGGWGTLLTDTSVPEARALSVFRADPNSGVIWMFGGVGESGELDDFWQYKSGTWTRMTLPTDGSAPLSGGCTDPAGAYDTDRKKLVIVCNSSDTFEFDGTNWKKFANAKGFPPSRGFSSMVYDPNIKKTILYGGYSNPDYFDETWTWDGTSWNRVTRNPAPARDLTMMWFDPNLNRTVVYGGLGQPTSVDRIQRYSDMWSFDGSGWTQITPTASPGERFGSYITVNPANGHVLLFGGLLVSTSGTLEVQSYSNDMWEWDGKTWTQLTPPTVPSTRESGGLAWDPSTGQLVLFGGWSARYLQDLWIYQNGTWAVQPQFLSNHRRTASH